MTKAFNRDQFVLPMKKANPLHVFTFFTLWLILSAGHSAHAQTIWGIKAGVNFSSAAIEDEAGSESPTQAIPRLHIGFTIDIPMAADFYIQPGLLYAGKGFKQSGNWFSGAANEFEARVSYLEIPVNVLYKPQLGIGKLLFGAGPYISYGTGGKWESEREVHIGDIVIENQGDVIFKNDFMDGEFGNYLYGRPLDYGMGMLAGYEFFGKLAIQFNAQWGLANLIPEVSGVSRDGHVRNKSVGFSIGYKF